MISKLQSGCIYEDSRDRKFRIYIIDKTVKIEMIDGYPFHSDELSLQTCQDWLKLGCWWRLGDEYETTIAENYDI